MLDRGLWALYAIDSDRGGLGISAFILFFDVVGGGWITEMTAGDEAGDELLSRSDNEAEDSFDLLNMHSQQTTAARSTRRNAAVYLAEPSMRQSDQTL